MSGKNFRLPKLGMRTVKTAISVFICLLLNHIFNTEVSLIAAIAAIVCMQSSIENTLRTGVNRLVGTAIGGGFGMLLLLLTQSSPLDYLYLVLMPLGIIVSIYLCNAIKMPGSSVICAIVYISVLVVPMTPVTTTDPYVLAVYRITETVVGIVVAMLINRFVAPPKLYETKKVHLVCDTYQDIYDRVRPRLTGAEELIMYDSSLITNCNPVKHKKAIPTAKCTDSVRVPVPTEYKDRKHITTAYITADYTVMPMYLKQSGGYVELPCETFPSTIVWQSVTGETPMLNLPIK